MKRLAWLGLAAAAYVLAAWTALPGFYDGIAPPAPYRWISPPPQSAAGNQQPLSGSGDVPVSGGQVGPGTIYTGDGQAELSFVPGSFNPPPGGAPLHVDIKPVAGYPDASSIKVLTNVYLITANSSLAHRALVTLRYDANVVAPSYIYRAPLQGGAWTSIGTTNTAAPYTLSAYTTQLGYFVAGYNANSKPPPGSPRIGGGVSLPLLVALGILIVIVATLPLAFLRRGGGEEA